MTKGCVRIGGQDIRELNPDGLLHYISEVFQENTLLSDTIYNNIKAGREDATEQEVIAAAKAGMDSHGFGMASVRFICGTQDSHKELEL